MFYEPEKDNHGLPFNPFKSIVVPRPIGWISTISLDGIVNLAPFSQFNNLAHDPPYVMFSANSFPDTGRRKDSVKNATDTGEFVVNMATYELREAVNITSQFVPPDVDEAALAGLEMIGSRIVKPAARSGVTGASGMQIPLRDGVAGANARWRASCRHRQRGRHPYPRRRADCRKANSTW